MFYVFKHIPTRYPRAIERWSTELPVQYVVYSKSVTLDARSLLGGCQNNHRNGDAGENKEDDANCYRDAFPISLTWRGRDKLLQNKDKATALVTDFIQCP